MYKKTRHVLKKNKKIPCKKPERKPVQQKKTDKKNMEKKTQARDATVVGRHTSSCLEARLSYLSTG